MRLGNKNFLVLLLVLLIGLVIGGVIGELFKEHLSILAYGESIGFDPVTIDLSIIELTLGFVMHINLSGVIGILIAFLVFRKLA